MAHDLGPTTRVIGLNLQGDIGPMTFYTSQRRKLVGFPRAPPLNPPSTTQEVIRAIFTNAATQWRALSANERAQWATAAQRAHLGITGYNAWTWFYRTRDEQRLQTIERQARITLARPP